MRVRVCIYVHMCVVCVNPYKYTTIYVAVADRNRRLCASMILRKTRLKFSIVCVMNQATHVVK